jgi:thymidylate synthase ThyX
VTATETNTARLILATRPPGGVALYTIEATCPLWVHVHLLTHKRIARNRNSARYMAAHRYTATYHTPPVLYNAHHNPLTGWRKVVSVLLWHGTNYLTTSAARLLARLGNHKEIANRVTTQGVVGKTVLTATEPAWRAFLALRNDEAADGTTRALAEQIQDIIDTAQPHEEHQHIPYAPSPDEGHTGDDYIRVAMARIARVSTGRPRPGQQSDLNLCQRLIEDGHLSPSEHIAWWVPNPRSSALCSKEQDRSVAGFGWEPLRVALEGNTEYHADLP